MGLRSLTNPQIVSENEVPLGHIYQNQTNGIFVAVGADGTELIETEFHGVAVQALLAIPNEEGNTGRITID